MRVWFGPAPGFHHWSELTGTLLSYNIGSNARYYLSSINDTKLSSHYLYNICFNSTYNLFFFFSFFPPRSNYWELGWVCPNPYCLRDSLLWSTIVWDLFGYGFFKKIKNNYITYFGFIFCFISKQIKNINKLLQKINIHKICKIVTFRKIIRIISLISLNCSHFTMPHKI